MSINQINSGNFPEKDIKKSQKSRSTESGKTNTAKSSSSKEVRADRFTPSGTKMKGDFDLAATELDKLRDSSFASLREVKKKIKEGAYDSKEVHKKIGQLAEKDIKSVEQMLSKMPDTKDIDSDKKTFSAEYKKYLVENPKVVQKVAEKITIDLKKI